MEDRIGYCVPCCTTNIALYAAIQGGWDVIGPDEIDSLINSMPE